jgi:hypothetical protein
MPNVDKPNGFRAVSMLGAGSGAFPLFTGFTKSNLTLNAGDALIMLSNGTLDIALAASTTILGVCQTKVTAVAATRQKITFIPAADNIVFSGQCSGTYTPVNAGESVDIEGATGVMEINENAQVTGVARIVGLEGGLKNELGDNARVLFTWTKSQWTGQS